MVSSLRNLVSVATLALLSGAAPALAQQGTDFCGRATADAVALRETIAKAAGVKEIFRSAEYIAYEEAASQAVFTFTEPGQVQAHPAAVCRKPVKDGDNLLLEMRIVCGGSAVGCQALESDFKLLNARMEAEIRNKAAASNPPK
jgi:hypothetical protein